MDSGFKHRVRESFVQWQQRGEGGAPETYALRLKNSAAAQQVRGGGGGGGGGEASVRRQSSLPLWCCVPATATGSRQFGVTLV